MHILPAYRHFLSTAFFLCILSIHHVVLYYVLNLLDLCRNLDAINNKNNFSLKLWHNVPVNVHRYPLKIGLSEKETPSKDTYMLISVKCRIYVTNSVFSQTGVRKWLTIFILSVFIDCISIDNFFLWMSAFTLYLHPDAFRSYHVIITYQLQLNTPLWKHTK